MIQKLIEFFRYKFAGIQLWYAIRLADKAHAKSKVRYYVMPDEKDRLVVMNRKGFRFYKKKGLITHEAKVRDVMKECFYFTPDAGGNSPMTSEIQEAKRLMWLEYHLESKKRH